ncbi:MAG TPA: alpha/beta hydrolase [Actinomycetes bacterium]|nr:alpha/beta hydrolase [Actinomycetes bacterium]
MRFTSTRHVDDVIERRFQLGEVPGILWTSRSASSSEPVPLILAGQPGGSAGMDRTYSLLLGRAQHASRAGFATATLEPPGSGDRPPLNDVEQARAELRRAVTAGEPVSDDIVDRLVLPLVDQAVPECLSALDALLALPEIGDRVGYSGGVISIAVRLAAIEPRVSAAVLFAGSFVPTAIMEDARQVEIPLYVLLQWDDDGNDRQRALDLFDAFGSQEKTLNANMGGHTGVPRHAAEEAMRFFTRHLKSK